jgi:hypothetical protein
MLEQNATNLTDDKRVTGAAVVILDDQFGGRPVEV